MFQRAAAAPDEFLTAARPRASGGAAGPAARRPRGRGPRPPGRKRVGLGADRRPGASLRRARALARPPTLLSASARETFSRIMPL